MPQTTPPSAHDQSLEATLQTIMQGTATVQGELFFRSLVQYLAVSLQAKSAFVAQFNPERTAVQTLAVWTNGRHEENFDFDLEGTPCQQVLSGTIQHFGDCVQELFPTNQHLKDLDARSYLAIPLSDDAANVVGHLAVIDDRPLNADERELSIFHIFAARATAELIRRQAEQKLGDSLRREQRLRSDRQRIEAEMNCLREELRSRGDFTEIVGESDGIWTVLQNIDMVATTDSTILILGETGTGKELVAKAIHNNSQRHKGPFVRVNCAALPESLLESELFGHEHGAFTGATSQRTGRFELADGGTIFLDEIGEMPLQAQSRLLRVLQEHELERVGGSHTIATDVRVLAATNRNLLRMVEAGTFREDLYYRLNVFPIPLPPLRERTEDIPTLVRYFLNKLRTRLGKKIERVPDSVLTILQNYSWPGNVRELENVIERAMILTAGDSLELPAGVVPGRRKPSPSQTRPKTMATVEREHIQFVLARTDGVIAGPNGAAKILDLNANTLRSRMQKLGIQPERPHGE